MIFIVLSYSINTLSLLLNEFKVHSFLEHPWLIVYRGNWKYPRETLSPRKGRSCHPRNHPKSKLNRPCFGVNWIWRLSLDPLRWKLHRQQVCSDIWWRGHGRASWVLHWCWNGITTTWANCHPTNHIKSLIRNHDTLTFEKKVEKSTVHLVCWPDFGTVWLTLKMKLCIRFLMKFVMSYIDLSPLYSVS